MKCTWPGGNDLMKSARLEVAKWQCLVDVAASKLLLDEAECNARLFEQLQIHFALRWRLQQAIKKVVDFERRLPRIGQWKSRENLETALQVGNLHGNRAFVKNCIHDLLCLQATGYAGRR